MPVEQHDIIKCPACGQRMRVPSNARGRVFKCVKCGALVKPGSDSPDPRQTIIEHPEMQQEQEPEKKSITDLFVDMGLVSREQMDQALEQQTENEKIFETLLRLEMITKDDLHARLSREPGAAAINLDHFNIDRELTELLPLEAVRKYWVLPISSLGKSLTVAMVCPVDMEALAAVEDITQKRIRPMLCKIDDFHSAVRKHYRVPDKQEPQKQAAANVSRADVPTVSTMDDPDDEHVRQALVALESLPIPARVLNQVDAVVGAESEGLRQVVSVVGNSPPLTGDILSMANCSAYGLPKCVDSVPMAITLIGDQAVALLAANAPKLPIAEEKRWKSLTLFSRHCAEIAAILAIDCGRVTPNVAYCAGLLHAVGSYALGAVDPEEYAKIDTDIFGSERIHAEKQVFGIAYPEAGALLCEQWRLPEGLQAAVRYSPTPEEAGDYRDIAAIVHIAIQAAGVNGEVNQEGLSKCADILKSLNIELSEIVGSLEKSAVGAVSNSQ